MTASLTARPFFSLQMLKHPMFRQGVKDMLPMSLGYVFWSTVTGVAMVRAGLSPEMALLMNLLVYAGSAQLAALPLLVGHASLWVILLAGLCVNLRFAIFSLHWRRFFLDFNWWQRLSGGYLCGDILYVLFMKRFGHSELNNEQMPYFWGVVAVNWILWQGGCFAGVLLGDQVPQNWGLEFAAILAIAVLVFSMLHGWMTWVAMIVTCTVVVFTEHFFPYHLNIVVAILAGIAAALMAEKADHIRRLHVKKSESMSFESSKVYPQGQNSKDEQENSHG